MAKDTTPQSGEGTETGRHKGSDIKESKGSRAYNRDTNDGDPVDPAQHGGGAQHTVAGSGSTETFTTLAGDEIYKDFVPAGMEVAPQAIAPGTWPSPIDTFRQQVAGIPLVGLIPIGDEKTPYPTGASLAAGKKFWLQQGYYKSAVPT